MRSARHCQRPQRALLVFVRVLSTGDTGSCSAGGTLFATASTSACCLAVNFSGTAFSVARIAMVWRLTMIDSGGLLSGLNAGQRVMHQILSGQRRQMMQQPVSHPSLFGKDPFQSRHRTMVPHALRRR